MSNAEDNILKILEQRVFNNLPVARVALDSDGPNDTRGLVCPVALDVHVDDTDYSEHSVYVDVYEDRVSVESSNELLVGPVVFFWSSPTFFEDLKDCLQHTVLAIKGKYNL